MADDSRLGPVSAPARFATTRWSLVLAAGEGDAASNAALAALCETYWYPLYSFARRLGRSPEDAQDLTQGFFAALLEKNYLHAADSERGRFRSFLLTAFRHFMAKQHEREGAQKRGGGRAPWSIDAHAGESRFLRELGDDRTPEKQFERRWAVTLLDRVLDRLQGEMVARNKGEHFDRFRLFLAGENAGTSYAEVGAELGLREGAVKVAVHRLRCRYREILREEIAETVERPEEVDEELRQLFAAVRG